jgi:hypothetical protein
LNSSEDPELKLLENKVSSAKVLGVGSRSNLRQISDYISEALAIKPIWRTGTISSFFDGAIYRSDLKIESPSSAVEVLFEDSSLQIFSNLLLLRNCDEIELR